MCENAGKVMGVKGRREKGIKQLESKKCSVVFKKKPKERMHSHYPVLYFMVTFSAIG